MDEWPYENEEVYPNDYPVYPGFLYVADGELRQWDDVQAKVMDMKIKWKVAEVRRCNMLARGLL